MFRKSSRRILKDALRLTKIKLVYERVTLTKWTTLYFFVALLNCIVLVVLQGLTLSENREAVGVLYGLVGSGNVDLDSLVVNTGHALEMCKDLPSQADAHCAIIEGTDLDSRQEILALEGRSSINVNIVTPHQLEIRDVSNKQCLQSLIWLHDTIRDSMREDVVTLLFHVWLFLLSFVAILNESLPHLGAALAGQILVTAWAGYRLRSSYRLEEWYNSFIVQGPCQTDFMGGWWDLRQSHTIPVIVLNSLVFLAITFLSVRLYKVYSRQSFKRVGASRQIHNVYRLVLVLSVCLQLAGFFTVASTGMWIDKASTGTIRRAAKHLALYRTVFSIMAALELPWVILGWRSVRREQRRQFIIFWAISLALLISASAIFASPLYVFIFQTWPFFANMTIVSYILIVATTVLGLVCRLHFGKGLPQFLKETEDMEGADFTPVYISSDNGSSPIEKKSPYPDLIASIEPLSYVKAPEQTYQAAPKRVKTFSIYSDIERETVKLSSTPPLAQGNSLAPVSEEMVLAVPVSTKRVAPQTKFKVGLPVNPKQQTFVQNPKGNYV